MVLEKEKPNLEMRMCATLLTLWNILNIVITNKQKKNVLEKKKKEMRT